MRLSVRKVGEIGIVKDSPPQDVPLNAWTDLENIRIENGAIGNILGYSDYSTPIGQPYFLVHLKIDTAYSLLYATDTAANDVVNAIYEYDGVSHTDISRFTTVAGDNPYSSTAGDRWSSCILNQIPIINNGIDAPQYWAVPGTGNLEDLPYDATNTWEDVSLKAAVVVAYKNYLVALNIIDNTDAYPTMVWWSNPADPGTVPTDWDYTDATIDAGRATLTDTQGEIVDAVAMRDDMIIYKRDAVHRMSFIGGRFIFRFQRIKGMRGALSKGCVAEVEGKHFVVGDGDIYLHDGQTPVSIVEDRIRQWFYTDINPIHYWRIQVVTLTVKSEVWVCYPSTISADGNLDKALVWNWEDNTWSMRNLPNVWDLESGVPSSTPLTWLTLPYATWTAWTGTWIIRTYAPLVETLYGAGTTLFEFEGTVREDGWPMDCIAIRSGIRLNNEAVQSKQLMTHVYPDITGTIEYVDISIGTQNLPDSVITWNPSRRFYLATDRRIIARFKAPYFAIKLETAKAADWQLHGYVIEYGDAGR